MLGMQKSLPKPVDFWATNYHAQVDPSVCTGCGTCVERCQVNATAVDKKKGISVVNLDRCIGCGNCVVTCAAKAITLVKNKKQIVPPADAESLYQVIADNKPGAFGKAKLITRLVLKR
jgi:Na+-translocating ferredoxin:NAD+ oxidoreductase subunit B